MNSTNRSRTLLCKVGLHVWVTRSGDGARWQECGRCGRYRKGGATSSRYLRGGSGDAGSHGAGGLSL